MRNLKKFFAVGTAAAMTMAMSATAFADKTITIHFQNTANWDTVGAWIYQGIAFDTNVTPADKSITNEKSDGSTKVLWPGAKMEAEGDGWYKVTATFTDEVDNKGLVMIFNNYVADSVLNDTTEQDDLDKLAASGVKTTATDKKEQTGNVQINKKKLAAAGGLGTDLYVSGDAKAPEWSFTAPASYTVGGGAGTADAGSSDAGNTAGDSSTPGTSTETTDANGNKVVTTTDANGNVTTTTTDKDGKTTTTTKKAGTTSNTTSPKTGDTVAVSALALAAIAAVAVVASKRKVNA